MLDFLFDAIFVAIPAKILVAILASAALVAGALYLWARYG